MQSENLVECLQLQAVVIESCQRIFIGDATNAIEIDEIGGEYVKRTDSGLELNPKRIAEPRHQERGKHSPNKPGSSLSVRESDPVLLGHGKGSFLPPSRSTALFSPFIQLLHRYSGDCFHQKGPEGQGR